MGAAKNLMSEPLFIMSVDVELLWGVIHATSRRMRQYRSLLTSDPENGRGCIDRMLHLCEKHRIPATWAVVGHLFLDRCQKEEGIAHKNMPRFSEDWYSCDPCSDIKAAPLYYGRDIIDKILSSPIEHEIGYHSFSHPTFSECSHEVAEAEIQVGVRLAKELGITLKSFVFPLDEIGHVEVLKDNGFEIYRGKFLRRWNSGQNFALRKLNGAIDKIIAAPVQPRYVEGIWELPSSMLFFDPEVPVSLFPRARLGLGKAIRANKVFHIFLHPHNLLAQPALGKMLDNFLSTVAKKRDEGKLQVTTMAGLALYLNEKRRDRNA